jgi:hypothetical protein
VVQVKVKEGKIEKWIMRKAFDDEENPYLPKVMVTLSEDWVTLSPVISISARDMQDSCLHEEQLVP